MAYRVYGPFPSCISGFKFLGDRNVKTTLLRFGHVGAIFWKLVMSR